MIKNADIETITVPARFVDLAERRTYGILRASLHDRNVLRTLAHSCYLQGLEDGYEAAACGRRVQDQEGKS